MRDLFARFAARTAAIVGSPTAFIVACLSVGLWLASGPYFRFNTGWNFLINSSTTVITFLLVCLLQATVNRDTRALQVKLDELLRANQQARTGLVDVEHRSEHEVDEREQEFARLHSEEQQARS